MSERREVPRRTLLFVALSIAGLLTVLVAVPGSLRPYAADRPERKGGRADGPRHEGGLENYDIRRDKGALRAIEALRARVGRTGSEVAAMRERFADAGRSLVAGGRGFRVEMSETLGIPEVIGTDGRGGADRLTSESKAGRADSLRSFVRSNRGLLGLSEGELEDLVEVADYRNPEDSLGFAHFEQKVDGVPVFGGEIKAGFTKKGEIIRVVNGLVPGSAHAGNHADFGDPSSAVVSAFGHIGSVPTRLDTSPNGERSSDLKRVFGNGDYATTAEKMYFPTEPGVLVPSWRVLIWEQENAYYVVVDAVSGVLLWRKNLTEDQTQGATYGVYSNPNAMIDVADSPAPLTPGPVSPLLGTQGAMLARSLIQRVGNEGNYSFNNSGWIPDGGMTTVGNNVRAGIDRDGVNGIDTNGEAVSPTRAFIYSYNPFNPNTLSGDAPVPTTQTYPPSEYQQGAVTQMFWITNWWHDEMYRLGFNEQAFNFQLDNFSRGGVGNDRVLAESQDSSGTNNANMTTPADGTSGRMQMYIFTAPSPDVDAALDADIVVHELTHGLSNRLHGNSSGLSSNMARGMGEGWSDFYAHAMLSEPMDPVDGVYTTGGYSTYALRTAFPTGNYYYGIRRFPKAVLSSVGANGKPHNPFTFQDIDATKLSLADGAFAPAFNASAADQVHAAGEVWSTMLWEVRGRLIQRLGGEAGNRRVLQLVTDGMKLSPPSPTFTQARDAIVSAAQAGSTADLEDVWRAFAARGLGYSAKVDNPGSGSGTARVTESFDFPGLKNAGDMSVSDASGDNDGFFEPGEPVTLTVTLANLNWVAATGVTVALGSGTPVTYGSIPSGAVGAVNIDYTVPAAATCGSAVTLTFTVNSSFGQFTFDQVLIVGQPNVTFQENFDAVTAPAVPGTWTAAAVQSGIVFVTSTNFADSAPNSAFARNPSTVGGGTDLTSPAIPITAPASILTFRHRYNTEGGWDGGALEISIGDGAYQDILAAGGRFISGAYDSTLGVGTNNPLNGRQAWSGDSGAFLTTKVQLPASAAGTSVRLRWRFGADDNTTGTGTNPGWYVDSVTVAGTFACSYSTCAYGASPSSSSFQASGGTVSVAVTTGAGCAWTAASNAPWVTVTSGSSGSGNGTVNLSVAANTGAARSGTVTVAGQTHTVSQGGAGGDCVTASLPSLTTGSGGQVTVPVAVGDTSGRNITAYDIDLRYDPAVIQPASTAYDTVGTLSSAMTVTPNTTAAGSVLISGFGTAPLSGAGTLLNLKFNVVGGSSSQTALTFQLFRFNEGDPCSTVSSGQVTVQQGSVAGTVRYYFGASPIAVPGVTLTAAGTPQVSATTGAEGTYTLSGFGAGSYTVTPSKSGQVSGISSLDASRAAQFAVGLTTLTANQQIAADATNNGSVTSLDASRIAQTAAGITNAGIAGAWKFSPASKAYSSVNSSVTGQDFEAILVGDVTGNWAPPSSMAATDGPMVLTEGLPGLFGSELYTPLAVQEEAGTVDNAGVSVLIGDVPRARVGETVSIPVRIGDLTGAGVTAFDFEVAYDAKALRPLAVNPADPMGTIASTFSVTANAAVRGRLKVSAFGVVPLNGGGELLNLRFEVIGARKARPMRWEGLMLNEGETRVTLGRLPDQSGGPRTSVP